MTLDYRTAIDLERHVTDHVAAGRLLASDMDRIFEMDALTPPDCRHRGGSLWRVMILPKDDAWHLMEGRAIAIEPRPWACWSRCESAAMPMLRTRYHELLPDQAVVLLEQHVGPEVRGIDIERLFRRLYLDGFSQTWDLYGGREQEVILPGGDHITPAMLVGAWTYDPDRSSPPAPLPGEIFLSDTDDVLVIDHVLDLPTQSPGRDWMVSTGGEIFIVTDTGGELQGRAPALHDAPSDDCCP